MIAVRRYHAACFRPSRFNTLWYWLLGVWVLEAAFWLMIAVITLYAVLAVVVGAGARMAHRRHRARRAATA